MKAIIAVNNLGFIGLNKKLPWKCSKDLSHFRNLTMRQNCLCGYNTLIELPKLSERNVYGDGEIDVNKVDWCIGGKKTYEKYCYLFTELHISHINDNTIGDTMFPNLSNLNKECKVFNYYFDV